MTRKRCREIGAGAISLFALLALAAPAQGAQGDIYVLDIGRTTADGAAAGGRIVQVNASGAEVREIVPSGPGVEPLNNPTSIVVDAQGFLIVSDTDGYNPQYQIEGDSTLYDCPSGCGAVIRVDPGSGASMVISRGAHWANPTGLVLPSDGDLFDDAGGPNDRLLVADEADQNIVAVDPAGPPSANQTLAYRNYEKTLGPPPHGGLRNPWGLAREPRSGDLLVTNLGSNPVALDGQGAAGCDDPEQEGFIARLAEYAPEKYEIESYICDPDFRAPRGIVIGGRAKGPRTAFVADPISFNAQATEFGSVYRIDGDAELDGPDVRLLSGGQLFGTPSGLAFDYEGDDLLVADESAFPPATGDCAASAGGCGGLIAVNASAGDQVRFSPQVNAGAQFYRDPIAVAVDRRGAKGVPPVEPGSEGKGPKVRTLPSFNSTQQIQYATVNADRVGVVTYPLRGFKDRSKVRLECLSNCPGGKKQRSAKNDRAQFDYPTPTQLSDLDEILQGRFRVTAFLPVRKKDKVVYRSRYKEYSFSSGDDRVQLDKVGCLLPGEKRYDDSKSGKAKTTTKCQPKKGSKGGS